MILIKTFYAHNDLRNYSYLITDKKSGNSWVIDPYDSDPIIDYIKKNHLTLSGILNTHQHFDHIRGNAPLVEAFKAQVRHLSNHEEIILNDHSSIETVNTPGHTMDHQVFIWKESDKPYALFSGDTLFNSGVGNCKGGGDVGMLFETTKKLKNELPASTLLYPGHDYRKRNLEFASFVEPENKSIREKLKELDDSETFNLPPVTLGEETLVNPFFRLNSDELRKKVLSGETENERELFIHLRKLRDNW